MTDELEREILALPGFAGHEESPLAKLLETGAVATFPEGGVLCTEGEPSRPLLLLSGSATWSNAVGARGSMRSGDIVAAGDLFVSAYPQPFTVVAQTTCRALAVDADWFVAQRGDRLVAELEMRLASAFARQLRRANLARGKVAAAKPQPRGAPDGLYDRLKRLLGGAA